MLQSMERCCYSPSSCLDIYRYMMSCWSHYPGSKDYAKCHWDCFWIVRICFIARNVLYSTTRSQSLCLLSFREQESVFFLKWSLVEWSSLLLSRCCVKFASTTGAKFSHIHVLQATVSDPDHRFIRLYLTWILLFSFSQQAVLNLTLSSPAE